MQHKTKIAGQELQRRGESDLCIRVIDLDANFTSKKPRAELMHVDIKQFVAIVDELIARGNPQFKRLGLKLDAKNRFDIAKAFGSACGFDWAAFADLKREMGIMK